MNTYIGKDNRVRTVIKDNNGKWVTKSYPRILMEQSLGRSLEPYEDVHHIYGRQEQISRNAYAECGLNGEPSPNGNTVPNTDD